MEAVNRFEGRTSMWTLTDDQAIALANAVQGKVVWDLGSGDSSLSRIVLHMGAKKVVSVDRNPPVKIKRAAEPWWVHEVRHTTFEDLNQEDEMRDAVALLAWPQNCSTPGLAHLVRWFENSLVYIGSNTNGAVCGMENLWNHLAQRSVVTHIPHEYNVLTHYGSSWGAGRSLLPDERAATSEEVVSYFDAYATGKYID